MPPFTAACDACPLSLPCAHPFALRYVRTLSRAIALNGGTKLVEEAEALRLKVEQLGEVQAQHEQVS